MKKIFKTIPFILIFGLIGCNTSKENTSINNDSKTSIENSETNKDIEVFDGIILKSNGIYVINNNKGLINFKNIIKGKVMFDKNDNIVVDNYFSKKTVQLGADIDLDGYLWDPIDTKDGVVNGLVFDGLGHTISHMTINGNNEDNHDNTIDYNGTVFTDEQALGFFGFNGSDLTVKNVNFSEANISATNGKWVGTVVGYMAFRTVSITNVHVNNSTLISNEGKKVGGIIGMVNFENNARIDIKNCEISNSTFKAKSLVGGIAGQLYQYSSRYFNGMYWNVNGCNVNNNTFVAKTNSKNTLSPLCSDDPELDFDYTTKLFQDKGNTEENNTYLYNQTY